jgi:hypothetical protein
VDAQDPDTQNYFAPVPALALVGLESTSDPDAPSGIPVTGASALVTQIIDVANAHDDRDHRVRRLRVTAKLPRHLTQTLYYHFVFRAVKNHADATLRQRDDRVIVTVEPQGG